MNDPTPYPDINTTLCALRSALTDLLGPRLIGIYLYGSLATGDFDPETSDIDFCVVTTDLVTDLAEQLEAVHTAMWTSADAWPKKLEGAYVDALQIRAHRSKGDPVPCVNEERFYLAPLGSDWIIQRHVIREHGIVICGPDPTTLIDPVSPDQLRGSVRAYLADWWRPMLDDSDRLNDPGYRTYAVLSMCRARYTLKFGQIASKRQSAEWLMGETPGPAADAIRGALDPGQESPPGINITKQLIRSTLDAIGKG